MLQKQQLVNGHLDTLSAQLILNCRSLKKQQDKFPSKSDSEQARLIASDILFTIHFSWITHRENVTTLNSQ